MATPRRSSDTVGGESADSHRPGETTHRPSVAPPPQPTAQSLHELQRALDEMTEAHERMQQQVEHMQAMHHDVELRLRAEIADAGRDVERRVSERTRELEQAAVAKDHFLAILSHELRTPLMPALLLTNALEQQIDLPADVRADLGAIRRNLELQVTLIDDLLDLTRIAKGKLSLNFRPIAVHELVHNVATMLSAPLRDKQLALELDLQASNDVVHGDPARVQQVLWNLLGNAIKFTPPGGKIRISSRDAPGSRLHIAVSDSGIGISSDQLPLVFDAFHQGKVATGKGVGGPGLGLGLTICRLMVEMHGGSLQAESAGAGTGSTFTLELHTAAGTPADASAAGSPAAGQPLRLLLVEDHEYLAKVLDLVLRKLGHSVRAVRTFDAARQALASDNLDLVLCDLELAGGDALELIHHAARHHGVAVIAMSSFGAAADVQRSRDAGAAVHLVKPLTIDSLCAGFETALPGWHK